MSLFGSPKPSPFGASFTPSQPQASGGVFGNSQQSPSPFGALGAQTKPGGLFGGFGQQQPQPQPQQPSGFGTSVQQNQSRSIFPAANNPTQPQGSNMFANIGAQPQQQQAQSGGGLFSGFGSSLQQGMAAPQQPQRQPGSSLFPSIGQPQQQLGSTMGGVAQQQQQPQQPSQLGQTMGQFQPAGSTIWTPGQGMTGVHRTVPMQMMIVKDKWDPSSQASPFRAYLYNNVGEEAAPFYQPGPNDDENKWEDALRKRPGPAYVPVLVKGFWELGKRAQRQKDFLTMMQTRLHEINTALTELLSRHDLKISVRIATCRRKHQVLSQRCLALAAKTQLLRNRGYAMDDVEEELAKKLLQLERSMFDPTLNGRSEEIWARMLAIAENTKRLQVEIERTGKTAAQQEDDTLSDEQLKTAKKILDDYASQIQHLNTELAALQKDYEALENPSS